MAGCLICGWLLIVLLRRTRRTRRTRPGDSWQSAARPLLSLVHDDDAPQAPESSPEASEREVSARVVNVQLVPSANGMGKCGGWLAHSSLARIALVVTFFAYQVCCGAGREGG